MKKLVIPLLGLPRELPLARPVAAQADLDVAPRVDDARPRRAGTSACRARPRRRRPRCRCRCACRSGRGRRGRGRAAHGADVGLGDRVVAAEHDRHRAGGEHLPDGSLDRLVRARGVGGQHRPRRRSRRSSAPRTRRPSPRGAAPAGSSAARIARGPKRAPGRSETRSSVGAPTIATSKPASSAGILRVRRAAEREQARVVGLLAVLRASARAGRSRCDCRLRRGQALADEALGLARWRAGGSRRSRGSGALPSA